MAYFTIMSGLRGCYMPDSAHVTRVNTRRELKSMISSEANDMREAYGFGGSKKDVAQFAAECWRRRNDKTWDMDLVLPFGREKGDRPFGLMLSRATRAEYLEYRKQYDD